MSSVYFTFGFLQLSLYKVRLFAPQFFIIFICIINTYLLKLENRNKFFYFSGNMAFKVSYREMALPKNDALGRVGEDWKLFLEIETSRAGLFRVSSGNSMESPPSSSYISRWSATSSAIIILLSPSSFVRRWWSSVNILSSLSFLSSSLHKSKQNNKNLWIPKKIEGHLKYWRASIGF